MNWFGIFNVFSAVAGFFKWITGYEHRRAGRMEAKAEALERQAVRANQRARIEDVVRVETRDALEDELRGGKK